MPPWARGPVLTVKRPMRTGLLPWARAGTGFRVVATRVAPAPTRNVRRPNFSAIAGSFSSFAGLGLGRHLERRALLFHPAAHRHVAELVPQPVDVGQHRLVGALDVDR